MLVDDFSVNLPWQLPSITSFCLVDVLVAKGALVQMSKITNFAIQINDEAATHTTTSIYTFTRAIISGLKDLELESHQLLCGENGYVWGFRLGDTISHIYIYTY